MALIFSMIYEMNFWLSSYICLLIFYIASEPLVVSSYEMCVFVDSRRSLSARVFRMFFSLGKPS